MKRPYRNHHDALKALRKAKLRIAKLETFIEDTKWGYDWGGQDYCVACGSMPPDHVEQCRLVALLKEGTG